MAATRKKTFEEWMKEVDRVIMEKVFLTSDDLPDCCYRDWYEDGVSVRNAANRAIKSANE
jgi:hypothetical protein